MKKESTKLLYRNGRKEKNESGVGRVGGKVEKWKRLPTGDLCKRLINHLLGFFGVLFADSCGGPCKFTTSGEFQLK